MNRYRFFFSGLGAALIFALAAHAQQASLDAPAQALSTENAAGLPNVDTQLKVLTEKLGLTAEQQAKIKPILKNLHNATEKLAEDQNLSHDERLAKVRPERLKADSQIRAVLTEDQKKKLDQYEQGPHPEMHGSLSGTTPPQ